MRADMLRKGYQVGTYTIESELGGGGFATVYEARDSSGNLCALKVLDPKLRDDEMHRARFLDEARIQLERLDHPNIVKVFEILATAEVAALVMEHVSGATLEQFIAERNGGVSYEEFLSIALPIVDAVGHAHERGVIHRDLKPANVLLSRVGDQLVPKVADFGIAKVLTASAKKKSTATGATMGTSGYMSPEQVKGSKNVTARSDVFSLGAMLYELASGGEAFDADSDYEIMDAIVKGRFRRTSVAAPDLPRTVADAIDRALSPQPGDRFGSCGELAEALQTREDVASGIELGPAGAGAGAVSVAAEASLRCVMCGGETPHRPSDGGMRCVRCGVRRGMPVERATSDPRSREQWVVPNVRDEDPLQKWIPYVGIGAIVLGLLLLAKCAFFGNEPEKKPGLMEQMWGRGFGPPDQRARSEIDRCSFGGEWSVTVDSSLQSCPLDEDFEATFVLKQQSGYVDLVSDPDGLFRSSAAAAVISADGDCVVRGWMAVGTPGLTFEISMDGDDLTGAAQVGSTLPIRRADCEIRGSKE